MKTTLNWLLFFGVLSMCYYTPLTDAGVISSGLHYRPDLFLYPLSLVIILVNSANNRKHASPSRPKAHIVLFLFATYVFLCISSSALAAIFLDIPLTRIGVVDMWDHIGCLLIAMAVYKTCSGSDMWRSRISWALLLVSAFPAVLMIVWVVDPQIGAILVYQVLRLPASQEFIGLDGRFAGITANCAQMTDLCVVSFGFAWIAAIMAVKERRLRHVIYLALYLMLLVIMTLWTGTRSGYLTIPLMIILGGYLIRSNKRAVMVPLTGLVAVSLLCLLAYAFLPEEAKLAFASRMGDDDRSEQWSYYLSVAPLVPLGGGLSYEQRYGPPFLVGNQSRMPPHNEFLCAWMVTGLPGECVFIGIMAAIHIWSFRGVRHSILSGNSYMLAAGALLTSIGYWFNHVFLETPLHFFTYAPILGVLLSEIHFGTTLADSNRLMTTQR